MKYHDITKEDMKNGDGLRTVLWVSGCEHRCEGCHNPVTWDADCGVDFDEDAMNEIISLSDKPYISGLTLSGGDPLYPKNRDKITEIAKLFKEKFPDKTIWLYTGYTYEDIKDLPVMEYIDILVDGKFIKELADIKLHWRGSSNQRIIDVKNKIVLE